MSIVKASSILESLRLGNADNVSQLAKMVMRHEGAKGGQHTNGGCHEGRCDYGYGPCAAFTGMCAAIEELAREVKRLNATK